MYRSRLIYLAIVLASFIFSQALYESVSFMTLIIALLMPVLSALLALLSYPLIKARIAVSNQEVKRLSNLTVRIGVRNGSPFIAPSLKITCSVPDELGRETERVVFALNAPFAKFGTFDYGCFFANRGMYCISVDTVEYYDFLKLIKIKKKINISMPVKSIPREVELMLPVSSEQQSQENSNLIGTAAVLSGGDMIGVREYSFGDNLKNVHWKLSSKTDDLIMKSFAEDVYDRAYVIADLSGYYDDFYLNKSITDCVVETAISAMRDYSKNTIRFSLIVNTGKRDYVRYPIETPTDLAEAERAVSAAEMLLQTDITDLLKAVNFNDIAGAEVCIISSFRSEDIYKSIQKIFIGKRSKLHIVNISETEQSEKSGMITYSRQYIEKRGH